MIFLIGTAIEALYGPRMIQPSVSTCLQQQGQQHYSYEAIHPLDFVYTGIQIVQNGVEQPIIQQKTVNIPPALVVVGQIAMGSLAGFWGVLLATPVILIIMTLINELYVKKQAAFSGEAR
jgi:AI-2E family transporter